MSKQQRPPGRRRRAANGTDRQRIRAWKTLLGAVEHAADCVREVRRRGLDENDRDALNSLMGGIRVATRATEKNLANPERIASGERQLDLLRDLQPDNARSDERPAFGDSKTARE